MSEQGVIEKDNKVPLCYKCKKAHAWRGECIDCYMKEHSSPYYMNGILRYPDTHNIRQGYYMEEEHYARMHRMERERRGGGKTSQVGAFTMAAEGIAAAKVMPGGDTHDGFAKNLFQTAQGVNHDKCPHGSH